MTDADIFWTGVSVVIFGGMNLAAYNARRNDTWHDEHSTTFVGFVVGLLVAGPMFMINSPRPIAFAVGLPLFFGTLVHAIYSWFECWPSTIKRREHAQERSREAQRELRNAQLRAEQQKSAQADLAQKHAALQAIAVEHDGVTNIAKQIVAELVRANT
jgi:hypothetical protein